jgi:DNA-binding response OmpR family regulator
MPYQALSQGEGAVGKNILIIEDDEDFVYTLKRKLRLLGYHVSVALDGSTGLKKAKLEHPDLIALDIALPKLNGFTICGVLKANEQYKTIPIIIMTGQYTEDDNCFSQGIAPDVYLTKPFKAETLFNKIKDLIG